MSEPGMLKRRVYLLTVLLCAIMGIGSPLLAADQPPATTPRGAELLKPFKQQLMGALQAGMQQGPAAAIDVCRLQAPEIAESLSRDGVALGRTSHRLRNPANAGPAWATRELEAYLDKAEAGRPRTVALGEGRTGYVEPIVTQPLCLACHGANLAPEIEAALRTQYPQDRATGFEAGELRGIFWVSYPE